METRSIKELLIILRDNEELFHSDKSAGLCRFTRALLFSKLISRREEIIIDEYINNNRPSKGIHYNKHHGNSAWYWPYFEWQPRYDWLTEQINSL